MPKTNTEFDTSVALASPIECLVKFFKRINKSLKSLRDFLILFVFDCLITLFTESTWADNRTESKLALFSIRRNKKT